MSGLLHLRYRAQSTLDLGRVGTYLLTRYGKDGRATFAGPGTMEILLDKKERICFLRFLRRHHPPGGLTLDEGKRVWPNRKSLDPDATSAVGTSASSITTSASTPNADTATPDIT